MSTTPIPIETARRERKRTQTLDHLAATAFALFEQHGYEAVTMEQIAEQGAEAVERMIRDGVAKAMNHVNRREESEPRP